MFKLASTGNAGIDVERKLGVSLMHKLGLIILAHTAFDRVRQIAKFWNDAGCPVVIHIDTNVSVEEYDKLSASLA